ncbi:hypothetical protein ACJ7V3_18110 [Halomonas elongata]|uniref:hypothetical protein n=1 Tax=Halomonas elongata TaxID=2746 RepID=UPI0038D3A537
MIPGSARLAPWQAFVEVPTRCVALEWLCAELEDAADDATQMTLARHPRFQRRLGERLALRHGLTLPEALPVPDADDLALFRLSPEAGEALARYCGMICHARAFVHEIRAPRVVELKQRFGEAPYMAALSNRDLALHGPEHDDDEALEHAVERDGGACLTAWLARQPAELTAWLRLGVLGGALVDISPGEAVREQGPAIVRRAATAMVDNGAEKTA